jgi:ParB-like chromosome segregation protein Spo0J
MAAMNQSDYISPVYNVKAVPVEQVEANTYNPNAVAPPEMKLLELSIWEDGFTQPVVTYYDADRDKYVVVDGFHRYSILQHSKRIYDREGGMLPIVVIDKEIGERMASTIRHNRARGTHNIDLMSNIIAELVEIGKGDRWIAKHLGMDIDEILRLKQITGLAALFRDGEFSSAWE